MNNENYLNSLQMINGVKIGDFSLQRLAEKHAQKKIEEEKQNEQKEIIRRLRIQNKKLQEQLTTTKKRIKQINAEKEKVVTEFNRVKEFNDVLSRALGSCSSCWGEDAECLICSGEGIPGWRKINKRLFNIYVVPSLGR